MPPIKRKRPDPNNPKSIPATTLSDLNEHCLLDIFRFLSPLDMCSVSETCKRLREVAITHMEKFYRSNELILSDQHTSGYKMMCRFGMAVTRVRLEFLNSPLQQSKTVISWFRKLKPKLESLTLVDMNFNVGLLLCPLLASVRQFRIEYVVSSDNYLENYDRFDILIEENVKQILKACKNVEEFSFGARIRTVGRRYQGIFLQQKFKHIRSLEMYEVRAFDINNLKLFLKFNRNVERISLRRCISLDRLEQFNWSQYAPNVEDLALEFSLDEYLNNQHRVFNVPLTNMVGQLEKLKCLTLDTCHRNVTNFVATMAQRNSLTHFSLVNLMYKVNEGLDAALSNLTNLKVLQLDGMYDMSSYGGQNFFKRLSRNLVIEELHLRRTYITHAQMGDIIENSINLKKIYFPPHIEEIFNEDVYGELVEMQSRKNVSFPITLFFVDTSFSVIMYRLRSTLNRNVINVWEYNLSDFDFYSFPRSAL